MRGRAALFAALVLLGGGLALRGDGGPSARVARIGGQLICPCGCTQGALVCNHVGCPAVTQVRAEIVQRAATSASDADILQMFSAEYGTQVLAVPATHGFDLLAWVMPWVGAAAGLLLLLFVVRRWSGRRAPAAPAGTPTDAAERIGAEIAAALDAELGRGR